MKYTRNKNSHYASYRAQNPQSAEFIAPQGKIANFMINPMDYLDPDQLQQLMQQGGGALRGLGQGAQDLYAQGVARTGINLPGIADQVGQGVRGLVGGENSFLQGQMQGVRNLADQVGQTASPYLQQAQQAASPYMQQAGEAFAPVGNAVGNAAQAVGSRASQAMDFLGNAASGIDPMQAGELGLAATGAAAGGLGLGRMARARRAASQAGQAVQGAAQQAGGMAQRARGAIGSMTPGQKVGLAAGGAGVVGAGAYGANRLMQDPEDAQYSYANKNRANFGTPQNSAKARIMLQRQAQL